MCVCVDLHAASAAGAHPGPEMLQQQRVAKQRLEVEKLKTRVEENLSEHRAPRGSRKALQEAARLLEKVRAALLLAEAQCVNAERPALVKCARCGDGVDHREIETHMKEKHLRSSLVRWDPWNYCGEQGGLVELCAKLRESCPGIREFVRGGDAAGALAVMQTVLTNRGVGTVADARSVATYYAEEGQTLFTKLDGAFRVYAAVLGYGGDPAAVKKVGKNKTAPWPIPPGVECIQAVVKEGGDLYPLQGADGAESYTRISHTGLGRALAALLGTEDADAGVVQALWDACAFAAVVVESGGAGVLVGDMADSVKGDVWLPDPSQSGVSVQSTSTYGQKQSTSNSGFKFSKYC